MVVYFYDDFEDFPTGWNDNESWGGVIEKSDVQEHSGSYSCRVYMPTAGEGATCYAYKGMTGITGNYHFRFWIWVDSGIAPVRFQIFNLTDFDPAVSVFLDYHDSAYYIRNRSGSETFQDVGTIPSGTWVKIEGYVDDSANKVKYYINGSYEGLFSIYNSGLDPNRVYVGDNQTDDSTKGQYYIDDVLLDNLSEPTSINLAAEFDVGQNSAEFLGKGEVQQSDSAELLGTVDIRQTGSAELLVKFDVGLGSAELLGKGEVQQSDSAELLGNAEVLQSGSAELLGNAVIRKPDSAELLGTFEAQVTAELLSNAVIRQSGSAELLDKFDVGQDSAELLGTVDIRQSGSAEILGKGGVQQSGSYELLGTVNIRQTGSAELLCILVCCQGSAELLGKGEVQQSDSAELLGKFEAQATAEMLSNAVIRHSGSAELLGKGEVQQSDSAELLGKVEVRQPDSAELLGKGEVQQSGSAELLGNAVIRKPASAKLLGKFEDQATAELLSNAVIRQSGSAELLGKADIGQGSAELLGKADIGQGSAELLGKADIGQGLPAELLGKVEVRQPGSAELLGKGEVQQSGSADLLGKFEAQATAELLGKAIVKNVGSTEFPAIFWIRHPYRLWTNRRYLNGVVELNENLIGNAILEYVIEGVMQDIQSYLINAGLDYSGWTNIVFTPKLIRRATTYGTVAALYARRARTFSTRVIPTITPVTLTAIGDEERAMNHWRDKMNQMLEFYVTSQGGDVMLTSTPDEEPVFSTEDIPPELSDFTPWYLWLMRRTQ